MAVFSKDNFWSIMKRKQGYWGVLCEFINIIICDITFSLDKGKSRVRLQGFSGIKLFIMHESSSISDSEDVWENVLVSSYERIEQKNLPYSLPFQTKRYKKIIFYFNQPSFIQFQILSLQSTGKEIKCISKHFLKMYSYKCSVEYLIYKIF